jgi:hypothetical protein
MGSATMKIFRSAWVVAFACFFSWGAFVARPSVEWQLALFASSVGASVVLIWLAVRGAIKWRERGIAYLISCLLIVVAAPAGIAAGRTVSRLELSHNLDRYNEAAQWVISHSNPDGINRVPLPSRYADLGYGVYYERDELCGTRIDFLWGEAFPVKHVVRRYATSSKWISIKECHKDWGRITPISSNWYAMSD